MKSIKSSLKPLNKISLPRPRVFSTNVRKTPQMTIPIVFKDHFLSQNIQTSRPLKQKSQNKTPLNLPKIMRPYPSKKNIHLGQIKNLVNFDHRVIRSSRGKSCPNRLRVQQLSKEALNDRRESHLNTYFNQRKNRLKEITKENLKIYVRINSQKSLYDSKRLNSSRSSLQNSRFSSRSSSKSLKTSNASLKKGPRNILAAPKIQIVEKSINKLQDNEMSSYLKIFCNNINVNVKAVKKVSCTLVGSCEKQNQGKMSALEQIVQEFEKKDKTNLKRKAEYLRYR